MHEAILQVTAAQLCQFLAEFDPATPKEKLQGDPHNFVRLLALLPKLSESGIKCENHRLQAAERQLSLQEANHPRKRGLSDEARRLIEESLFDPPER